MSELTIIGVVGAGQMGCGIAQVAAQALCNVILVDSQSGAAERGRGRIDAILARLVEKGTLTQAQRSASIGRIAIADDLAGLGTCDVVIEAASEDQDAKKRIFAELDRIAKPDAILASNTSSISITLLGA
jgi:3-hydroxybutyryl-CoA dehydrogenase